MSEAETRFWEARKEYLDAKVAYNMLSNTEAEGAVWHYMQAAWEKLRAAHREVRAERGQVAC